MSACPRRWRTALEALLKTDFDVLVPGHGAPLTKAQVHAYHGAFDRLLECTASDATDAVCIDGWTRDAADLLTNDDKAFAKSLLGYYARNNLRNAANVEKFCSG